MSNVGFRIITEIQRPKQELIKRFKSIPQTAFVADAFSFFYTVDPKIRILNKKEGMLIVGVALTVRTRPSDNLFVHKAMDIAQPGDVIVIDAKGNLDYPMIGGNMATYGMRKGLAGFIIDGAVRDLVEIEKMDFPIFARGVNLNGAYREGPGEINVPISCGGVVVNPGDIIFGDKDGVIVVPKEEAENVLEKVKEVIEKEKDLILRTSNKELDREWVDRLLVEKGYKTGSN